LGDLVDLLPMPMVACPPLGGGVRLAPGTHRFETATTFRPFDVTSLSIHEAGSVTLSAPRARTATIESWNAENRSLDVSAGPATYLAVAQNYNSGWTATLGGHTLRPIRLVMAPDRIFRLLLALGAALLVALLALALLPGRARKVPDPPAPAAQPVRWVLFAGALVVLGLVAGPWALVAVPVLLIGRKWGRATLAATAFVAFLVAGVAAAWDPAVTGSTGAGAFSPLAQIASVIALAAVLCVVVLEGRVTRRRKHLMAPIRRHTTTATPEHAHGGRRD
jgi:arabinofuranan 3-O-arabinosyltransferase